MNGPHESPTLEDAPIVSPIILTDRVKFCPGCNQEKSADEFYKTRFKRPTSIGLTKFCKECLKIKRRVYTAKNRDKINKAYADYREKNLEKVKARKRATQALYIKNNVEKVKLSNKNYQLKNAEKIKARQKQYREKNKEKLKIRNLKWVQENPEKVRATARAKNKRKRSTPKGKLSASISRNMQHSLPNKSKKRKHWETIVGYTVDQLKKHLEKQFKPGMNWHNCGRNGWHIDHIVPISAFNYTKPEDHDFKVCWSLKNLQPLWESENISKGAKLSKPFQPSLSFGE